MTQLRIISPGPDYDPATCVTTRELRSVGPDMAWLPLGWLAGVGDVGVKQDSQDKDLYHFNLVAHSNAPWRYVKQELEVDLTP